MSLPVIIVRVKGGDTALDRNLCLLLHNARDNLEKLGHIHEATVADIPRIFRQGSVAKILARAESPSFASVKLTDLVDSGRAAPRLPSERLTHAEGLFNDEGFSLNVSP